jgi:hypothetical protein
MDIDNFSNKNHSEEPAQENEIFSKSNNSREEEKK